MKRFDNFLQAWAAKYRPMQHDARRNPRFFQCSNILAAPAVLGALPGLKSPALFLEYGIDGEIHDGRITRGYTVGVMVRAASERATDFQATADALAEGEEHLYKLLAYLRDEQARQRAEQVGAADPDYLLNMNLTAVPVERIPRIYGNWSAVFMQVEDVERLVKCVDPADYVSRP